MSSEVKESFEFQSEVKQLLEILVYSLYKNKEVFLRELISNASDALNKVQHELLVDPEIEDKDLELKIEISFDKKKSKLIVEDTGIGMSREELIQNIGTIAHSGTIDYLKKVAEEQKEKQVELIGKFGVGFYASFMVARNIAILTKSCRKGSRAFLWKSQGETTYSIEETEKKSRGTRIELTLKKEEQEYLEKERIKDIIKRHSKFVPFPILIEGERIEKQEAIWTQPRNRLQEKEYLEFYKFLENTQEEPETSLHLSSDAPVQFNALLYIPKTSFEISGLWKSEPGIDLYSKKVLIQKGCREVIPEYLRFVKGVVDSEDIPLNISRETMQNNLRIEKIKKHIVKKLIEHLDGIKTKDPAKYRNVWNNFHKHFKEGIIADMEQRERLAHLLLFASSRTGQGDPIDLKTYCQRMAKEQKEIYFVSGANVAAIEKNPALEIFHRREYEVLYLFDPLDELALDHLHEFEGKQFRMVESADIKLEEKKEVDREYRQEVESFLAYLKTTYGDRIQDVRISERLVDSPCLLTQAADGPSAQMEKIIKMVNKEYQFSKRILEINPDHALIRRMVEIHKKNPLAEALPNLAWQLLESMLLREGVVTDMEAMIGRMQRIMLSAAEAEAAKT